MGPVSFEAVGVAATRDDALTAAQALAAAGIRVASIREETGIDGAPVFQLIVRGSDAVRAGEVLDTLDR